MTKAQALPFAKALYAAYRAADTAFLFGRGEETVAQDYCYKHGWIIFGGHSFNSEDCTGIAYDINQGGWAFI